MAKHTPKSRSRKYLRGSVDESVLGGTLAAKTVISAIFDEVVQERTLASSIVATYAMGNWTIGSGRGPVMIGIAHSDYSDAEIEAMIESTGSWDEGDLVQQELAKRKIRRIGIFAAPDNSSEDAVLNDGNPIKTKLNWVLLQGQTLRLWIYNTGTAAFATSDPVFHCQGHINLWPSS